MELEGILKACRRKVVPYKARMTVTTSDSKYSRVVVLRTVSGEAMGSSICFAVSRANFVPLQSFQGNLGSSLLCRFLAIAVRLCQACCSHLDSNGKDLVVFRSLLPHDHIAGLGRALPLQEFLQLGFMVHNLNLLPVHASQNPLPDKSPRRL